MAKRISEVNIGVTATTGPARKALKEVSADAKTAAKDLAKVNGTTPDMKGVLRRREALLRDLDREAASRSKNRIDVLKKIGGVDLAPEGMMNHPAIKAATAAVAVAAIGDALGRGARGSYEATRDTGISMGVGANLAQVVEGLPVIGSVIGSLKESAGYLTGIAQYADITERTANAQKMLIDAYLDSAKRIKDLRVDSVLNSLANARTFNQITQGGEQGRMQQLADDFAIKKATDTAAMNRDLAALEERRRKINSDYREQSKPLQNTAVNGSFGIIGDMRGVREEAASQLSVLSQAQSAANRKLDEEAEAIRNKYKSGIEQARELGRLQTDIAAGDRVDTKGIADLEERVGNMIKGGAIDEIDALRKSFEELGGMRLGSERVAAFNAELDRLKQSQDELAGKRLFKQMAEDLENFGLTADEIQKKQLMAGGLSMKDADKMLYQLKGSGIARDAKGIVENSRFAYLTDAERKLQEYAESAGYTEQGYMRLKLALDTEAAADQAKQFMSEMMGIDKELAVERAGLDEKARRDAEINARDLTAEQKKQLIAKNDELDALRSASEEAKKMADDAKASRANPDLMLAGSAAFQRAALVASGRVVDSSNPQLRETKKQTDLLQKLVDQGAGNQGTEGLQ